MLVVSFLGRVLKQEYENEQASFSEAPPPRSEVRGHSQGKPSRTAFQVGLLNLGVGKALHLLQDD